MSDEEEERAFRTALDLITETSGPLEVLDHLTVARQEIGGLERDLILAARQVLTWRQIAAALGMNSPQAAQQRCRRLRECGAGPLTLR